MTADPSAPDARPEFSRRESSGFARQPLRRKALRLLLIVAAHGALAAAALTLLVRPALVAEGEHLYVRLVEEAPRMESQPPAVEPARPLPMARQRTVHRTEPTPVVADAPAATSVAVAASAPSPPAAHTAPASAAPPVVVEASYDADYLHNSKPEYPLMARRLGNEGKVLLRVRVSSDGSALAVEIGQSSGFPRLDAAARDAVLQWRFAPARRGDEAIESWALVPIVFRLDR